MKRKSTQIQLFVVALLGLFITACSPNKVEVKFEKFDLSMTAAEAANGKAPDFMELTLDGLKGRYDFNISKHRMNIEEMVPEIYPSNLPMLETVITGTDGFESVITGDEYPEGTVTYDNGAFGMLYSKTNSKGKVIKDYIFYYEKGGRYFQITPVFNNDLEGLDLQLEGIKSLK